MSEQKPATRSEKMFVGIIAAAAGVYFMLIGAGLLPVPGGPRNLHAPLWIVFCAGLPFFLGGAAVFVQGIAKADGDGELPAGAPRWLRTIHYLAGLAIFLCFAAVASWIAIGGDARGFSGSFLFFSGEINVLLGRAVFGLGAIVIWLCTIGFAVSGARKLLRRSD